MKPDLRKKLRQPIVGKEAAEYCPSLRPESLAYPQTAADGRDTLAGVYRKLYPLFCVKRKLNPKTVESYDAVMARQILGVFDSTPFEELEEEDFFRFWKTLQEKDLAEYALREGSIVIRGVMDLAFQMGMTHTILWGVPAFDLTEQAEERSPALRVFKESDEGQKLAQLGVRIRRTISLETELKLVHNMLEDCQMHGELFAALFMICLGARTSEATAFSWEHFCEIAPGYWALIRYDVSEKDSRHTTGGGKTNNAFRLLPVPRFLAKLLNKRRKFLRKFFTDEQIKKLPIACKGEDYTLRCTQRELNQHMKYQYRKAGVQEELMLFAFEDMRHNPEVAADCEKSATAYLGRHQFATAMVCCGLSLGEIYTVMGHKEEDEDVKKADFSNPDQFRMLADKMSRRPLTQFFDQQEGVHVYEYTGTTLRILDDGDAEIRFPGEAAVKMTLIGRESGQELSVEMHGIDLSMDAPVSLPRNDVADTLSIRPLLHQCARRAWQRVYDQALRAAEVPEEDGPEPVEEITVIAAPAAAKPVPEEEKDSFPALPLPSPSPAASSRTVPASASGAAPVSKAKEPGKKRETGTRRRFVVPPAHTGEGSGGASLVLTDSAGGLREITRLPEGYERNRRGTFLASFEKGVVPRALLSHDPGLPALVLSPDGTLFRLPACPSLVGLCTEYPDLPVVRALLEGGILLQDPVLRTPDAVVVCLADTGAIRKVSLEAFGSVAENGRKLVKLNGETIVSACLCAPSSDLLLVSRQGQALRLAGDHLRSVVSPGCELVHGIALREGDRAAVCIPYTEGKEYLIVKAFGQAVRLSSKVTLLPHGRNSMGSGFVRMATGDRVLTVLPAEGELFLLSNTGRGLCVRLTEIPVVKSGASGVIAIKLRGGELLLAARMVPCRDEMEAQDDTG